MGPSALERALVAHLAPEGLNSSAMGFGSFQIDGLVGWGSIAARARIADRDRSVSGSGGSSAMPGPNSRPFGHLPDLAALTSELKRRLG
jgi:hypothetical protein